MTQSELTLSLQFADPIHRTELPRHKVMRWVRAALITGGAAEITVRIVGQLEAQTLNRDFRGKDYPTNVLTFDYSRSPVVVADLVLCAAVIQSEAQAQNTSLPAHYAHMLVHGTLHAQGFDHDNDADATLMEAEEIKVLHGLGFENPYAKCL
jgi:probable rRNA maturation factor